MRSGICGTERRRRSATGAVCAANRGLKAPATGRTSLRDGRTRRGRWRWRTLAGDDQSASDFKYIPVRRTALFIEESVARGTQWAVFEPNDEPLWARLRLAIGEFLGRLFRQGAMPREAYFVKCGRETTTPTDSGSGIIHLEVGFAPLKPAEFVFLRIRQSTAQSNP